MSLASASSGATDLIARLKEFTKTPPLRLRAMIDAVDYIETERIPGDIAECGIWQGGNIVLARHYAPNRLCWLYDTFDEGMVAPGEFDRRRSGFLAPDQTGKDAVTVEQVRDNLDHFGLLDERRLRFVRGRVEETLLEPWNIPERLALLRLDTNWYQSTKAELEALWPVLSQGGILLIDDYGHWMGCKRAVDEYFGSRAPHMVEIDYACRMIVKPYICP